MNKNEKGKVLFLNEKEIKEQLSPGIVLALVEESFAEYSKGNAVNPIKLHLPIYPTHEGYINAMPAYLRELEIAGMKFVSVYKDNMKEHKLPVTMGSIVLNDPKTGAPYAFMDGTYITAARTGASVGVMAKYLARNNSEVFTVVGSGAQGLASFIMIRTALPAIKEVRVVDINPEAQERFIKNASEIFPDIKYIEMSDIQEACTGAQIIVAAATSPKPLLIDINFDKGATVLCIEEDITNRFARKFDSVIVDFTECFIERTNVTSKHHADVTGEPYEEISKETLTGEIGDVITGKLPSRKNQDDMIMASPIGMGITDIIIADYVYQHAIKLGKGLLLDFLDI